MLFNALFSLVRGSRGPRNHPRRAMGFRPGVEALGERCLPCASLLGPAPGAGAVLAAAASTAAEVQHAQPFHLEGAGQVVGNPFAAIGAIPAAGHATHLGAWTNSGTLFVAEDGSAHGHAIFKAANGDSLGMTFTGQIGPDGHATGTFVIDPSTSSGRFARAAGTLRMDLQQDLTTGAFTFTLDGEITYSARDRAGQAADLDDAVLARAGGGSSGDQQFCRDSGGFWHHRQCSVGW